MPVLTQGKNLADWLVDEFSAPHFCRAEKVVLVDANLPSGTPLGVHTLTPALYPYDNSAPATVTAINLNALVKNPDMLVTSITDSSNTATVVTPSNHGLVTGDIVKVTGATVDTDLNGFYAVTVTGVKGFTFTSGSVTDTAYTETTLRIFKANQNETCLVKGPAVISAGGLTWAAACGTTESDAGIVDIKAWTGGVTVLEGV
jgi:hypothetical protein